MQIVWISDKTISEGSYQGNGWIEAPGEGAEDGVLHSQRRVGEREIRGRQGNSLALSKGFPYL